MTRPKDLLVGVTANIVAKYVSSNALPSGELSGLISSVHSTLKALAEGKASSNGTRKPAVPIKTSVTPDFIICLEDGRKLKSLRRHLRMRYGLSPEQYRARWGLSATYPMVAPNYGAYRSQLAKSTGLGRNSNGGNGRGVGDAVRKARTKPAQPEAKLASK